MAKKDETMLTCIWESLRLIHSMFAYLFDGQCCIKLSNTQVNLCIVVEIYLLRQEYGLRRRLFRRQAIQITRNL
jgi:hypothetical protein